MFPGWKSWREKVAEAVAEEKTHLGLDGWGLYLSDENMRELTALIGEELPHLTSLDVRANAHISDEGAVQLAALIESEKCCLKILDASATAIGDVGVARLAKTLELGTLKLLDLSRCQFGCSGAARLAEALCVNSSLIQLHIWHNNITRNGVRELVDALKVNGCLLEFGFDFHDFGYGEQVKALLERNHNLVSTARSAALFLIGIRCGTNLQGMGDLGRLSKDVVILIAKQVWATRGQREWIQAALETKLPGSYWECMPF